MQGDLISRDGAKKIVVVRNTIKVLSTATNEVIKEKKESYGDPRALGFSDDGEKVLYIFYHRGSFVSTSINVWDFKVNKSWRLNGSDHWAGYLGKLSYNGDFSIIALSGDHGISLVRPYERKRVWHLRELADAEFLRLEEEKGLVWISHEIGVDALSIKDGSSQSRYRVPSKIVIQ